MNMFRQYSVFCYRITLLSVLIASLAFTSNRACAVTISGEIRVAGYDKLGETYSKNFPFWVSFDAAGQWQAKVNYSTNYVETCGSDGQKTCYILKFSYERLREDLGPSAAKKAVTNASIVNGACPFFAEATTRVVWFAYASSPYFLSTTNPLPALWSYGFRDPTSHALRMNVEFLNQRPRIPSKADFFFSTAQVQGRKDIPFLSKGLTRWEIEKSLKEFKKFDNQLGAEYKVLSTTNVANMVLPLEFLLEVFSPAENLSSTKIQSYHGVARRVTEESPESFLLRIDEPLVTTDYRFSDGPARLDGITYTITNNVWPSTNDAALVKRFEDRKANSFTPKVPEKSAVLVVRAFLIFTVATFPILILRWALRRRGNQQKTHREGL